jgi:hypothetical protein
MGERCDCVLDGYIDSRKETTKLTILTSVYYLTEELLSLKEKSN